MSQHQHPTWYRRDFLRATLAGTGFWIAGQVSGAESKSANEKLNIACIGIGGRGAHNVAGVEGENLVAFCDVDEQRAAPTLKKFPQVKLYQDFRKMLEERKDIDAVVVSTPDHTHAPASVMALRMGKHVYCEKPLAHEINEARLMASLAVEKKLATQMGNQGHSSEAYRNVVGLVQNGAIGTVREVHAWCHKNFSADGRPTGTQAVPSTLNWDLWLGPAPERPYHSAYLPFNWRGWNDFGTGGLGDMACHILDPIFWSLNLRSPQRITAAGDRPTEEGFSSKFTVRYDFTARGDLPPVSVQWYTGYSAPDVKLEEGINVPKQGQLFIGDKGMLLSGHTGGLVALLPQKNFADFQALENTLPKSVGHHAEWIAACKNGTPTGSNFPYGAALTEAVLLGNIANSIGKPLDWDAANFKIANLPDSQQYLSRQYRSGWTL